MSVDEIKNALEQFKKSLRIGRSHELNFLVFDTQTDAFGQDATVEKEGRLQGGYDPETNNVIIIAEHTENLQEAIKTFQHEILGHYGLNLFEPSVKEQILNKISQSRNILGMAGIWKDIDSRRQGGRGFCCHSRRQANKNRRIFTCATSKLEN